MIPANDLTIADNMIFATSGSRLKREGLDYLDSAAPAVTHYASTGTTRTLTFASAVDSASNDKLVVGEAITVAGGPTGYNGNITITAIPTTTTIEYTGVGNISDSTTSTSAITVARNYSIVALHDYWRTDGSNVKVQRLVAATSQPKFFRYDTDGNRLEITNAGTALGTTALIVNTEVMNDRLIFAFDSTNNTPKMYRPESSADVQDLGGSPPNFSVCRTHLARLWTNDKANKDRLHYSATGNPEQWEGAGDSGYLEIDTGDGDAEGITIIHPPFKDSLFVTKGRKTYRVVGNSPATFQVIPVSTGIGGVSQRSAVAVDLDDIVYASQKGFHSLAATDTYGDFEGAFISEKIQPTFNAFNLGRLKYCQTAYVQDLNSVAFAVSDGSDTANGDLYLYNFKMKAWYRWPDISCQSIATKLNSAGETKLIIGTNAGRIMEAQNGEYSDFSTTGISYRVKTGTLYPGGAPNAWVGFKRLTFLYRPIGDFVFTATVRIDNQDPQSFSFQQESGSDILGTTFTVGSSVLGVSGALLPYSVQLDGFGRGCTIEVTQSGTAEQVEIHGVIIEFEPADAAQEVLAEG
jgi:hypothetical protein